VKVYNVDASDAHNELAMVEYVEDIYRFYKSTEDFISHPSTSVIRKLKSKIAFLAALLIDWIFVKLMHCWIIMMSETLCLTVYIIDQYLSMENVSRKEQMKLFG
jgi:cyclin B